MSNEGHHPLLRSLPGATSGWSATVTVAGKTYHVEAEYPAAAIYNLATQLADDLGKLSALVMEVKRFAPPSALRRRIASLELQLAERRDLETRDGELMAWPASAQRPARRALRFLSRWSSGAGISNVYTTFPNPRNWNQ